MPTRAAQPADSRRAWRCSAAIMTPVGISVAAHAAAAGVFFGVIGAQVVATGDEPIQSALLSLPPNQPSAHAMPTAPHTRDTEHVVPTDLSTVNTPGVGLPPIADAPLAAAAPTEAPRIQPALGATSTTLTSALHTGDTGVSFAGLSASGEHARSVVYVVDASGPMVTSLPWVIAEVQRSIGALAPTQRFGVVLFRDDGRGAPVVTFDARLNDATARQRARLAAWLEHAAPAGKSNPLDGLRAALAMRPQVIFLLSRSIARSGGGQWGDGLDATLRELDRLNPVNPATGDRRVIIRTIQFLEPDPTGTMQAIGRAHGGAGATADVDRVIQRAELGTP